MGRGKIEIKRIENSSNRSVTFSKRKKGIIKKANEISVMCDAEISLVIYSSSDNMHDLYTSSTSLPDFLCRYQQHSGNMLWNAEHENLSNEIERVKKENDSMQIKLRHLKGEDLPPTIKELIELEDALETGLANIRDQQSELAKMVRRNVKIAEDENRELTYKLGSVSTMVKQNIKMLEDENQELASILRQKRMTVEGSGEDMNNIPEKKEVHFFGSPFSI